MKSIGRRETVVIAVLAMLAVIAGGWFLLVSPASSKVSSLKAQAATQEQDNDGLRTQIQVLKADKKKLPAELAELQKLSSKVPASAELPSLLRQMQSNAKASGVELLGITPTSPAPLAGATGIDAVNVTLIVKGGYAEVEQFDSSLETLSRAFLVSGFTLTSSAGSSSGTGAVGSTGSTGTTTSKASTTAAAVPHINGGDIQATFNGRVLLRTPSTPT